MRVASICITILLHLFVTTKGRALNNGNGIVNLEESDILGSSFQLRQLHSKSSSSSKSRKNGKKGSSIRKSSESRKNGKKGSSSRKSSKSRRNGKKGSSSRKSTGGKTSKSGSSKSVSKTSKSHGGKTGKSGSSRMSRKSGPDDSPTSGKTSKSGRGKSKSSSSTSSSKGSTPKSSRKGGKAGGTSPAEKTTPSPTPRPAEKNTPSPALLPTSAPTAKPSFSSESVCKCAPLVFEWKLDLSRSCEPPNISQGNGTGIFDSVCLIEVRGNSADTTPTVVTSIGIFEVDQHFQILGQLVLPGPFIDGDVFNYASVEPTFPDEIVRGIQVVATGEDGNGVEIVNTWSVVYSQLCDKSVFSVNDSVGWTVFSKIGFDGQEECRIVRV